jgi:hypothetical protein
MAPLTFPVHSLDCHSFSNQVPYFMVTTEVKLSMLCAYLSSIPQNYLWKWRRRFTNRPLGLCVKFQPPPPPQITEYEVGWARKAA